MIPGELHEPEFELLLGCPTCAMHSVAYKNVSKQTNKQSNMEQQAPLTYCSSNCHRHSKLLVQSLSVGLYMDLTVCHVSFPMPSYIHDESYKIFH